MAKSKSSSAPIRRTTQSTRSSLLDGKDRIKPSDSLRLTRRTSSDSQLKVAGRVGNDLDALLASKSDELVRLLELSEETSRRVVAAELDLRREHELHERLASDLARIENEVAEVRTENASLSKKKEALADESHRLHKQVDSLARDNEKLGGDVEGLGKDLKAMAADNSALEARRAKLGEDIARLKKLRQEYLGNISKLKADKDELTS